MKDKQFLKKIDEIIEAAYRLMDRGIFPSKYVWMSSWGHPTQLSTPYGYKGWGLLEASDGYFLVSWMFDKMCDSDCAVLCWPLDNGQPITTETARPIKIPKEMVKEIIKEDSLSPG